MDRLPNRIIGIGLNLFLIAPTSVFYEMMLMDFDETHLTVNLLVA